MFLLMPELLGLIPVIIPKANSEVTCRAFLKKDLMENITLQTKLDLFSNYLKNFGNIDVSWETLLSMKVNKFISATLSTHLLYDHDITIAKEDDNGVMKTYNSKVQFKEVLAVGFTMKF